MRICSGSVTAVSHTRKPVSGDNCILQSREHARSMTVRTAGHADLLSVQIDPATSVHVRIIMHPCDVTRREQGRIDSFDFTASPCIHLSQCQVPSDGAEPAPTVTPLTYVLIQWTPVLRQDTLLHQNYPLPLSLIPISRPAPSSCKVEQIPA